MAMKHQNKFLGAGVLAALSASLCCIAPVAAIIIGTGNVAANFSWMEPARPYLAGATLLILGYTWYQHFKTLKEADCECDTSWSARLIHSKKFLASLTIISLLLLAFPSYASLLIHSPETDQSIDPKNLNASTIEFNVKGMTCDACATHVEVELGKLSGIFNADASYKDGNAIITYDPKLTTASDIQDAINNTGYQATETVE